MELIFATSNQNKVKEFRNALAGKYEVKTLAEIGFNDELPEEQDTIEGNSLQKTQTLYNLLKKDCLGEDTGLEVAALNGEPGVLSARYAGEAKDNEANMDLLLKNLLDKKDRSAQFKTVITLILSGKIYQFEGILKGSIGLEKKGSGGFGYDPIFVLENGSTLAELSLEEKSAISHRGKAVRKLMDFLQNDYIYKN
ncbi:MAG: RdgB/HAM1 family non-canonical purine NTP pyrophosphatase [Chitinophagales bacterium]